MVMFTRAMRIAYTPARTQATPPTIHLALPRALLCRPGSGVTGARRRRAPAVRRRTERRCSCPLDRHGGARRRPRKTALSSSTARGLVPTRTFSPRVWNSSPTHPRSTVRPRAPLDWCLHRLHRWPTADGGPRPSITIHRRTGGREPTGCPQRRHHRSADGTGGARRPPGSAGRHVRIVRSPEAAPDSLPGEEEPT